MTDVFISYKREDREAAERLASELKRRGFEVWWDLELLSGQNFRKAIRTVIDQCAAAVVLWSVLAVDSDFVMDEAGHAKEQDKLCPARLDDCKLPFGYGNLHTVDLTSWTGEPEHEGLLQLTRALSEKKAARATAVPEDGKSAAQRLAELEAFRAAEVAGTVLALQSFLKLHPSGAFAQFVANQIEDMKARKAGSSAQGHPGAAPPRWLIPALGGGALLILLAILISSLTHTPGPVHAETGPTPSAAAAAAGYDLASLHPDVRKAVEAARTAEARAKESANRADMAADKADDAAARADKRETGYEASDFGDTEQRRFAGARVDNQFTGPGVVTWGAGDRNGYRYRGELVEGDRAGAGVFEWTRSGDSPGGLEIYKGEFTGDKLEGFGIATRNDAREAGRFRDDLGSGPGVVELTTGDRYEGERERGQYNGAGVLWDIHGQPLKAGIWKNGALVTPLKP
jgi:hypothetical protein